MTDNTNKQSLRFVIYMSFLGCIMLSFIGYAVYREAWILPPTKPANIEELATWSELDLWRLMEYYNCSDIPWRDISDDLKELDEFCKTAQRHWSKRYDEKKLIDALEGLEKFNQE